MDLKSKLSNFLLLQVQVEELRQFRALPSELLEPYFPRRHSPTDGKPMKFLEKGTGQVKEVWHLFALYDGKGL